MELGSTDICKLKQLLCQGFCWVLQGPRSEVNYTSHLEFPHYHKRKKEYFQFVSGSIANKSEHVNRALCCLGMHVCRYGV